jgi:hypothetical protein
MPDLGASEPPRSGFASGTGLRLTARPNEMALASVTRRIATGSLDKRDPVNRCRSGRVASATSPSFWSVILCDSHSTGPANSMTPWPPWSRSRSQAACLRGPTLEHPQTGVRWRGASVYSASLSGQLACPIGAGREHETFAPRPPVRVAHESLARGAPHEAVRSDDFPRLCR